MQQRVNWRVTAHVNVATDDARFLVTPETAGDRLVASLYVERQSVFGQQFLKPRQRQVVDKQYVFIRRGQAFTTKRFA